MSEKNASTIKIAEYTVSAKTNGIPTEVLRLFPAILTCIAVFYGYSNIFSVILPSWFLSLSITLPVIFTAIFSLKRFSYKAIGVGLSFVAIFLFYLRYKDVLAVAVARMTNDLIARINLYYQIHLEIPSSPYPIAGLSIITYPKILFIAIIILVSLLTCYFLSHNGGIVIILTVAGIHFFISTNLCINLSESSYLLPLTLFLIALVQAIALSAYHSRGYSLSAFMSRLDMPALPKSINTTSFIILTLAISIFLMTVPQKIDKENYAPNTKIIDKAIELSQRLATITTNPSYSPPTSVSLGGGIGKGKLDSSFNANNSETTRLRVKAELPVPMLVKGYVASVYDGKRWTPTNDEQLDVIVSEMKTENIPAERLQLLYMANIAALYDSYPTSKIEIQNVSSDNGFYYTPYIFWSDQIQPENLKNEAIKNDDWLTKTSLTGTSYVLASGDQPNSYLRLDYPYADPFFPFENIPDEAKSFLSERRQILHDKYDSYVRKLYTEIPENMAFLEDITIYINEVSQENNYNTLDAVAAYLSANASYDLNPGNPPTGMDYTEYFLTQNKRGYCVHFATAATLILRSMGIPARYAEGYVVRGEDFNNLDSEGFANIPAKNAHAWVEYWTPYSGWLPFDPTPSYSDVQAEEIGSSVEDGSLSGPVIDEEQFIHDTTSQVEVSEPISSEVSSKLTSEPASSDSQVSSDATSEASSTIAGDSSAASDSDDNSTVPKSLTAVAKGLITIFLLLASIAIIIFLRKRVICWLLTRKLLISKNRSTIASYHHAVKILALAGLKPQPLQEEIGFINELDTILIEREKMQFLYSLAQKAKFAKKGASTEERNLAIETITRLGESYYTVVSPYKKIIYKVFFPEFKKDLY